ncbi:unknown protein [Bathycoccus prasinos]|uniref:Uncharacterized protein n=1 Tax=Bathycoccus prasinos TaxID=41875 RepID=K8ES64_9CHLO|nr:unknown protein [Bathycoccus prasinos]CCO20804.1 unknown protein [Bathycoccus prasinos]|eukprot:XP_007508085.1 unknown protein [Bathycoccus prasinos]
MNAAREETAERIEMILDNSEKIVEARNYMADKNVVLQSDLSAQGGWQFANSICNDEYLRTIQLKAVERSEIRAQLNTDHLCTTFKITTYEILPLEINNDLDDFLNDNNDGFPDENENLGGSY